MSTTSGMDWRAVTPEHPVPLRPSPRIVALGITWELRIAGVWRVFYSVDAEIVIVDVIDIARKGRETTEEVLASREDEDEEKEP